MSDQLVRRYSLIKRISEENLTRFRMETNSLSVLLSRQHWWLCFFQGLAHQFFHRRGSGNLPISIGFMLFFDGRQVVEIVHHHPQ